MKNFIILLMLAGSLFAGVAFATPDCTNKKTAREENCIRVVFDNNAGRLNNAYQHALSADPYLQGEVDLVIYIAASGDVTQVEASAKDANMPSVFLQKIQTIIKGFKFAPAEVDTTVTHKVNFISGQ